MTRKTYVAVAKAPTPERPCWRVSESGETETAALLALGAKLARLGVSAADIEVYEGNVAV